MFRRNVLRITLASGLSQTRLAAGARVAKSAMSRMLNGAQDVKLETAASIAQVLGVPLDALIDEATAPGDGALIVVTVTTEERDLLKCVRKIGIAVAFDRILGVGSIRQQSA
jgi:transcriptional regulator with XRE-family HTH domain